MKYTIVVEWNHEWGHWQWWVYPSDSPASNKWQAMDWGFTLTRWGGFWAAKRYLKSSGPPRCPRRKKGATKRKTKEVEV